MARSTAPSRCALLGIPSNVGLLMQVSWKAAVTMMVWLMIITIIITLIARILIYDDNNNDNNNYVVIMMARTCVTCMVSDKGMSVASPMVWWWWWWWWWHTSLRRLRSIVRDGHRAGQLPGWARPARGQGATANLRTKILDSRGFDSSIIFMLRGGILMAKVNSLESLSQRVLVAIILVGRLGVRPSSRGENGRMWGFASSQCLLQKLLLSLLYYY